MGVEIGLGYGGYEFPHSKTFRIEHAWSKLGQGSILISDSVLQMVKIAGWWGLVCEKATFWHIAGTVTTSEGNRLLASLPHYWSAQLSHPAVFGEETPQNVPHLKAMRLEICPS